MLRKKFAFAANNVTMLAASVPLGVVASNNDNRMIAKYSEIYETCTFHNCEIKLFKLVNYK